MTCEFCQQTRAGVLKEFKTWAEQPFSVDMTAGEWFLFIGLIIVILGAWNLLLYHIVSAVRSAD